MTRLSSFKALWGHAREKEMNQNLVSIRDGPNSTLLLFLKIYYPNKEVTNPKSKQQERKKRWKKGIGGQSSLNYIFWHYTFVD